MSENFPNRIGPFQILKEIGKGGMSFVYQALDTRSEIQVALKVLPTRHADDPAYIQRFVREGQNAARLTHPNIVKVYGAGEYDDYHTISMELVEGGTLTDYLRGQWDLLPPRIPVAVIQQLSSGLDYAHRQGFLHRDIKPSNLLLTGDLHDPKTRVLISDFGVARRMTQDLTAVTQSGYTVGTPNFMSPEQARGEENIDHRSDIYSLGAVAYVLFTGKMPFKADTQLALMHKVVYEAPTPPEELNPKLPPGVAYSIKRVLAKDPNLRFDSAAEFALAIEDGLTWEPSTRDMAAIDDSAFPKHKTESIVVASKSKKGLPVIPTLFAALAVAVALLALTILPAALPARQWLGIEPVVRPESLPILLTSYVDPDNRFQLDVPSSWTKTTLDDSVSFESTEFVGRLFVQRLALSPVQEPLEAALESYVRQPNLPFKELTRIASEQPLIQRENAADARYAGKWLGVDIVLRLIAVTSSGSEDAYVVGTAIDVAEQDNFGHLTDAVMGTFSVSSTNAGDSGADNESIAANDTGQIEGVELSVSTAAPLTSPPTEKIAATVTPVNTPTPPATDDAKLPGEVGSESVASESVASESVALESETPGTNISETRESGRTGQNSSATPTRGAVQLTATTAALQAVVNQKLTSIASAIAFTTTPVPTATSTLVASATEDGEENDSAMPTATRASRATLTVTAVASTATPKSTATSTPRVTSTSAPKTSTATTRPTHTKTPPPTRIVTSTAAPTHTKLPTVESTPISTAIPTSTATSRPTSTVTPTSTATSRPTSTVTPASTATSRPTATPTKLSTSTRVPTNTSAPTAAPTATSTGTTAAVTAAPILTATMTRTPVSEATATPQTVPTRTSTPTRSVASRSTLVATITPTETQAPVSDDANVTLVEPLGDLLKGQYTFAWESNVDLQPGQLFELVFWEAGRDPVINGFGLVEPTSALVVDIDLDEVADALPPLEPGGNYEWGVLLVTESPYRRLKFLGGGHTFRFERSDSRSTPTP